MDAQPPRLAARPDPQADQKRPALVAGAVAAKLGKVIAIPRNEPGSDFDRQMRARLEEIERVTRG